MNKTQIMVLHTETPFVCEESLFMQSVILDRHELPRLVGGCIAGPVQAGRWWVLKISCPNKKNYNLPNFEGISVVGFGPKSHYQDLIGRTALGLGCGV